MKICEEFLESFRDENDAKWVAECELKICLNNFQRLKIDFLVLKIARFVNEKNQGSILSTFFPENFYARENKLGRFRN